MALTKEQEELNSVLKADYVLWFGKKFKKLPKEIQHTLLENLYEWGLDSVILDPSIDKEFAYGKYTWTMGLELAYDIQKVKFGKFKLTYI